MTHGVSQLFAIVDAEDDEEIHFIAADEPAHHVCAKCLRPVAKDIANRTGKAIRVVRFSSREDLEVILPGEYRVKH